jgi:hypothetical protein
MAVDAAATLRGSVSGAWRGLRVEPVDRGRAAELASGFADHNYRQTWDFARLAGSRAGAGCEAVAIRAGARTIGLAVVRIRRLALLGGIAYVSGGPLTRAGAEFDAAPLLRSVEALRDEYVARRGLLLRVAPPPGPESWNREVEDGLSRAGFAPSLAAGRYRTMVVPLTPSLADVRRRLRQKWRNCLNSAERQGLVVRSASGPGALDEFAALYDEFAARKGFGARHGPQFFGRVQRSLPDSERLIVLAAERDGVLVAGHVSSALGDTMVYLLGATSPDAAACKAGYLLQWRAIEAAVERGCRWYDLGGTDPDGNPGVYHFKEGLGGDEVVAAGPSEVHPQGRRARLILALEARYRALRGIAR